MVLAPLFAKLMPATAGKPNRHFGATDGSIRAARFRSARRVDDGGSPVSDTQNFPTDLSY